ncbi:MAG: cell wall metabolism sensor histidine kinase WalK [Actinobacteria bacterium]|nr:cell wall metabolism sensor histidine kinase WalK [Actinomycetota bacterium]
MRKIGLALKIWMAMLALVVLVLGLSAVLQSSLIARIYLKQQSDRLLESGSSFARDVNLNDQAEVEANVYALASALSASVMAVDSKGAVISWSGRHGMGRGAMLGRMRGGGPGIPVETADLEEVLSGETIVRKGVSRFFGADVLLVAIPVKKAESIAGAVIIQSPMAPIEANVKAIEQAVLYSLLLGLAAATLLAFVFSRRVTGPILKINSVARSMAEGNFGQKINFRSGNELGVLAESINTLSGQLKEKISTIEEMDSTRRGFVANISHELRTPLTIIQGYTEALMDGIARDDQQKEKYLLNIYSETMRLSRLVNDVLDLRRLETGQISMNTGETDIADLIKAVADQYGGVVSGSEIRVLAGVTGERLTALVDPDRIRQVIINLVDNAVRYSPAGGTVEIKGEGLAGKIKVSVSDQGPGVAEKDRGLIWERFYKTSDSRLEREYSGSGLGLSIAKEIIERHGGAIGVESRPGEGSEFWFTVKRT